MGHADAHDDLDGFCCQGCKDDAAAGRPSSCDGESCGAEAPAGKGTGATGDVSFIFAPSSWDSLLAGMNSTCAGWRGTKPGVKRIMIDQWFARQPGWAERGPEGRESTILTYVEGLDRHCFTVQGFGAIDVSQINPAQLKPAGKGTGCLACGSPDRGAGRGTGCLCNAGRRVPVTSADDDGPMAMRMPGGQATGRVLAMRGRATGRATGTIEHATYPASADSTAWSLTQPGETDDEAHARVSAYLRTRRLAGESDASWVARVNTYLVAAPALEQTWIRAMQLISRLPVPADASTTRQTITGTGTPPAGTPASANTSANAGQIIAALGPIIANAGNTVIGLVHEANLADAAARRDAATTEAARIAAATSQEAALSAAVTAAEGAAFDAQTANRQRLNGDRITATTTLSGAQGRLAAALGAAVAFGGNATLTASLGRARDAIATTAAALDSTAPVGTSAYGLDVLNPGGVGLTVAVPWYQQPYVIGAAILAAIVAIMAGKKT